MNLKQPGIINNFHANISAFDGSILEELKKIFQNANIYYKPILNGDRPDILILEKNKGVILIDICILKLSEYKIKDKNTLMHLNTKKTILSPVKKLANYKNNLFKSHIDGLLAEKVKSKNKAYSIVRNMVIFQHETDKNIIDFFGSNDVDYTKLFSKDSFYMMRPLVKSSFFTQKIYNNFLEILTPIMHNKNKRIQLYYTKKQEELSISKVGEYKIRGVAGAGKTYVLAKRAINSHVRHSGNILILTYNKSLKRYIAHKLDEIPEDFHYKFFHIDNYHNLITTVANNLSMTNDTKFEDVIDLLPRYKSIFIDEVQDYETGWLRIIKKYFLEKDGEFVVFGDEKQNVYDRELDSEKKINTTVRGRWNELKDSFRFHGNIVDLTNSFQEKFLSDKYDIVKIERQNLLNFDEEHIEYIHFDKNSTLKELAYAIHLKINNDNLILQNVSIIGSRIKFLQDLDYLLRNELQRPTHTIFETEEYLQKYGKDKISIDEIRNFKKSNFNIYADAIKLSTIQSFKGYEAETLFFIITEDDLNDETIYTAFTRAKENLYIVNVGNEKYDEFFKGNISGANNIQKKVTREIKESIVDYEELSDESKRLKEILKELEKKYQLQKDETSRTNKENIKLQKDIEKVLAGAGQFEVTVKYAKKIESLLEGLGAEGKGMHTKLSSIREKFPESLSRDIRWIGNIRNGLMHEDGFEINNYKDFCKTCKTTIGELELLC